MLDAVCTPLVLDHFREDTRATIENLIDDLRLRLVLQVLKSMLSPGQIDQGEGFQGETHLDNERAGFVTS